MMMTSTYALHEFMHTAAALPRAWTAAAARLAEAAPDRIQGLGGGRELAAGLQMFERMTRRYGKPGFGIASTTVDGRTVGVTERVVWERPFCRALRFERHGIAPGAPRLLIVAPMSGHHATLVRGTVEAFLPTHDVHVTDWADASSVPLARGGFGFDDYVDYLVDLMTEMAPDLHVMAICQPAVQLLAAVALMEAAGRREVPRSIILVGGPIDTRRSPTAVNRLATTRGTEWFRDNCIATVPWTRPGFGRRVYPGFLQLAAFVAMNPERHAMAHLDMYAEMASGDDGAARRRKGFYDEYLAVADLAEDFFLETIERVFVRHQLSSGRLFHRGVRVDPSAIERVRLMAVEGEKDDITGIGQTSAALDLCTRLAPANKAYLLQPDVGHYGLFNGSRFRNEIAPRVLSFMQG